MKKDDKLPQISIIVPVYRVEEYLNQCVDSILSQTFGDFELILVDDGSPDNCGKICEKYATEDARVRVIHQKNAGLSAARNAGLRIARGEYLAFVDSDDYIAADYLEVLYTGIRTTGADFAMCGYYLQKDGKPDGVKAKTCTEQTEILSGKELSLRRYQQMLSITAWAKLFSRHLFLQLRFPEGRIYEDQAIIPRVFYLAEKVVLMDTCHYYYRVRQESITNTPFHKGAFDNILHMNEQLRFLKEKGEKELYKLALRHRNRTLAQYTLQAKSAGITQIPKGCRMSELRAFAIIRKINTDEKYSWYLLQLHPKWVRFHSYYRKIESIVTGKPL